MNNKDLFINSYLKMLSDAYKQTDDENKNKDLAFEIFSIAVILDKPFEEVYNSIIVENGDDGGFDGIYMEQLDDTTYIQHVFQCKNSSNLKKNQLNKFNDDYTKVFVEGNQSNQLNISNVLPFIDEYKELTDKRCIITSCLYFVFNGNKNDEQSANKKLYENYYKPNEFEIWDKNDLYAKITLHKKSIRKEIDFVFKAEKSTLSPKDPQAIYSFAVGNVKAINFRVATKTICELLLNERKVNGSEKYLFEENIRAFLKYKAKPNKKMKETLMNASESVYFPFFNNGITLVVEQLDIPLTSQAGEYLIKVKNPQIVNGLQTSKVLLNVYEESPELLEGVSVNLRIYETDNKELIEKITDATNTQSPINFKDKLSTNQFIKELKQLFSANDVDLIVKRGELFITNNDKKLEQTISSECLLKFWYATYYERPELAKNSVATVLQQFYDAIISSTGVLAIYFSNANFNELFEQMLTVYKIYRCVQNNKSLNKQVDFIKSVDELMSYGIYKYLCDNSMMITDENIENAYSRVFINMKELFADVKKESEKNNKVFSYNNFLKNSICRAMYDEKFRNV